MFRSHITIPILVLLAVTHQAHAGKIALTKQNAETDYVQFVFDDEVSVSFAPAGNENLGGSCSPSQEGALRHNKKIKIAEFCNGTSWIGLQATSCPAGQVATFNAAGQSVCVDIACPKGQMLTKDISGQFTCTNIVANMDCVVETPIVRTGWMVSHKCSGDRRIVSGTCWRRNETSKPNPPYDNWQNGLFTGRGNTDNTTFNCVFENGNDPSNPNRWPGMGVAGYVLCCK